MSGLAITKEVVAESIVSLDKVIFLMKDKGEFNITPTDLRNFEIMSEWIHFLLERK